MKHILPEFNRPTEEEYKSLWKEALFIFDANTLLNIYRFPVAARDSFLTTLEKINSRIWVPFHAALEFQRNRNKVIAEQSSRFLKVRKEVCAKLDGLKSEIEKLDLRDRHVTINPEEFYQSIDDLKQKLLTNLDASEIAHNDKESNLIIQQKIDAIFFEKVGKYPDQTWVDRVSQLGEVRYENFEPPGYEDQGKSDGEDFIHSGVKYRAKYGDLYVWFQIIEWAKENSIKKIIFVTDERKEDWWWIINEGGLKTIGPRPELRNEIKRTASVDFFYIYTASNFLKYSKDYLNLDVSNNVIEQVKSTTELATESFSSKFKPRGSFADVAVLKWLQKAHGVTSVFSRGSWPDFVTVEGENDLVGFEVVYVQNDRAHQLQRYRQNYMRAFHEIRMGRLKRVDIILASDDPIYFNRLENDINSITIKADNIRAILGYLRSVNEDGDFEFIHVRDIPS